MVITFPKIIHQTWKTAEVPEKWKKSPEMWKQFHPDWEYKLWTDADNRAHIRDNYPEFLDLYDSYPHGIQRADFIRYFILKDFGGVYSDLDLYPNQNIESFFEGKDEDVYFVKGNVGAFTNAFIVSKKGAPFWDHLIAGLKKKKNGEKWAFGKHLTVMTSTGPLMLTSKIETYDGIVGLLPKKVFNDYTVGDSFDVKHSETSAINVLEGSSWHSFDSKLYNFVYINRTVFVVLGILFVVLILFLMVYYIFKSKRCEKFCKQAFQKFKRGTK
jgi:mannosyltransferase OCH1-like enzyme